MSIEFRVLGPLEISVDGREVSLAAPKQQALLGYLLVHANEVVAAEQVASALWADDEVRDVRHALQALVSKVRRALARAGAGDVVVTRGGGYLVEVDADRLDLRRFEQLLREARDARDRGSRERALVVFEAALALWRGSLLAAAPLAPRGHEEIENVNELRVAALEEWAETALALGRDADATSALEALATMHPLRERARALLMLALYRSGRQADALAVYRETRRRLRDEVGLEPGPALRDLEQAILHHDPRLARPAAVPERALRGRRRRGRAMLATLIGAVLAATALPLAQILTGPAGTPAAFADSFRRDSIDGRVWDVSTQGAGPGIVATADGLVLTLPAHAQARALETVFYVRLASYCSLAGAFDIQLRYELLDWPRASGATLQVSAAFADVTRVSEPSGVEAYRGISNPEGLRVARWRAELRSSDRRGSLRLVRNGSSVTAYVRRQRAWHRLLRAPVVDAQAYVLVELSSTTARFAHRQVRVRLREFRVNSGSFGCAPT